MRVVTRENFSAFAEGLHTGQHSLRELDRCYPDRSPKLRADLHALGFDISLLSDWQIVLMWYYFTDFDSSYQITDDVVSNIADSLGRFVAK